MKYLIATAAILAASSAHADVSKVKVFDHTKVKEMLLKEHYLV
jgi:hypothetical protein